MCVFLCVKEREERKRGREERGEWGGEILYMVLNGPSILIQQKQSAAEQPYEATQYYISQIQSQGDNYP